LQFGALVPILRLHSNRNAFHERRPWHFDKQTEADGIAALKLHAQLKPFFASLGAIVHDGGKMPLRPLYYLAPDVEDAYNCPTAFALGDDIVASPIVEPLAPALGLAPGAIWLPDGEWFDF
jgi:alpha-glucosidase (family GH31 glycosyl hydrolase)